MRLRRTHAGSASRRRRGPGEHERRLSGTPSTALKKRRILYMCEKNPQISPSSPGPAEPDSSEGDSKRQFEVPSGPQRSADAQEKPSFSCSSSRSPRPFPDMIYGFFRSTQQRSITLPPLGPLRGQSPVAMLDAARTCTKLARTQGAAGTCTWSQESVKADVQELMDLYRAARKAGSVVDAD